jgi:hypothetical protein
MVDASDSRDAQQSATQRHIISKPAPSHPVNPRSGTGLSERHQIAIELLLRGLSDQAVASQLGVDRGTVFRWRRAPAFQQELNRQRQAIWEQSATEIQSMISPALAILRAQLTGTDPDAAFRAASVLLRFATPSRLTPMKPEADSHLMKAEILRMGEALFAVRDERLPNRATPA